MYEYKFISIYVYQGEKEKLNRRKAEFAQILKYVDF